MKSNRSSSVKFISSVQDWTSTAAATRIWATKLVTALVTALLALPIARSASAAEFRKVAIKKVEDLGGDSYHLTLSDSGNFHSSGLILLTDGTRKLAALKAKKPIEVGDQDFDTVLLKQYPDFKLIQNTEAFFGYFQVDTPLTTTLNRNSPIEPGEEPTAIRNEKAAYVPPDEVSTFSYSLWAGPEWTSATVTVTSHATTGDTVGTATTDSVLGYALGFTGQKIMNPSRSFGIESGLFLTRRGNVGTGANVLSVPVIANWLVGHMTLGAGLNFGYLMNPPDPTLLNGYNRIELGVIFQGDYAVAISNSTDLVFGLRYLKSLSSLTSSLQPSAVEVSTKYTCVDFLVGFQFGFGTRPAGLKPKPSGGFGRF